MTRPTAATLIFLFLALLAIGGLFIASKGSRITSTPKDGSEEFAYFKSPDIPLEFKYPAGWQVELLAADVFGDRKKVVLTSPSRSTLTFLPWGGFGRGLPYSEPYTSTSTIAGYPVKIDEFRDNEELIGLIKFSEAPPGWAPKEHGIEFSIRPASDDATRAQIADVLKSLKIPN